MSAKNLSFAGIDTVMLAEKYGTPLYVMSEDVILDKINQIKDGFLKKYPNTKAFYASKAFSCLRMCRIMDREGIGLDAVSGGEIYTALAAGFNPKNIIFHGNNKTEQELLYAIENGVGQIAVDSISEIDLIEQMTKRLGKNVDVLVRINPSTEADTHHYINTGQKDCKFGVPLSQVLELIARIDGMKHVNYKGLHFHIGSMLFKSDHHIIAAQKAISLIEELKKTCNIDTEVLNIGGGLGVDYMDRDNTVPFEPFIDDIMNVIEAHFKSSAAMRPEIYIEPGRWISAEAGITLYSVGVVKEIPDARTYVSVNGGMPDNPRPILYSAVYDAIVANKNGQPADTVVTIAGKCCETGDILIHDIALPKMERGDTLAVLKTGAYNYSMASHYNKTPKPAVVFIRDGKDELAVKRESYEDLARLEL